MVDVFQFEEGKRVLLVGEGNFTFTISLLNKLATSSTQKSSLSAKIIASCFQKYRDLSGLIKENAKVACKLGESVV